MSQVKTAVLIPGNINQRVIDALEGNVEIIRVPGGEAPALDPEVAQRIKAVAVSGVFKGAWMDLLPNLEIVANFGVGYDGIEVEHAAKKGIIVTNTPDVLNDEVADTTIALLLNTLRNLYNAEKYLRDGRWEKEGAFALSNYSLKGRKVGIFGMGRIGQEIAKRLEAFKVEIAYHTRNKRSEVDYTYYPTLKELAAAVDTLICIVPGTASTHKIINAEILQALGKDGVFINIGRGSSVDEEALIKALRDKTIGAAGLDVFYAEPSVPPEFLELDNVSLLPHVGSASIPTRNAMADLVSGNILKWVRERTAITPVAETPLKG